jgi:hypothetical protein
MTMHSKRLSMRATKTSMRVTKISIRATNRLKRFSRWIVLDTTPGHRADETVAGSAERQQRRDEPRECRGGKSR